MYTDAFEKCSFFYTNAVFIVVDDDDDADELQRKRGEKKVYIHTLHTKPLFRFISVILVRVVSVTFVDESAKAEFFLFKKKK